MIDDPLPRATERLVLRRFALRDLARFQAYRRDPEVGRYQGWSAMDDAGAAAFLAEMAAAPIGVPGEWFQMAIAQKSTNDLVGDIGVCRRDDGTRTAEIGFTMAPFAQGRGLGTEAVKEAATMLFAAGHVELIECITDTRNLPSIRLLERLGMRLKRTQDTVFKGEKCTEQVYSLILAQWNGILFTSKFRR